VGVLRVALAGLLFVALLALIPTGPAAAEKKRPEGPARPGLTVFASSNCFNSAFQPAVIIIACGDASTVLEQLVWQTWTEAGAQALGVLNYKSCPGLPSVACRNYDSPPATVSLFRPRFCRKARKNHFTRVYVSAPAAREPSLRSFTTPYPCKLLRK
jgi:hypothetical protein